MIERQLRQRISKLSSHFPVVAVLGPRQVGKTTLSKMIRPDLPKEALYLDLENPADDAKLSEPLPFFELYKDKCVIIDEIQRRADLFPILRSVIDQHRVPCRFLLLGSASPDLVNLSSESLAGRIVYTELTPLNLLEIRNYSSMEEHWLAGGFPEPFLLKDRELQNEWFNSFIMTYVERDLPMLGLRTNAMNVRRFITMLAHSHGQVLNKSTFAKSLELSVPTISHYINYLEHAYLIRCLAPYYTNIKKRLVKSPKLYIRDSGLAHHLLRIISYDQILGHPLLGHSWEGYVIEQIISTSGQQYEYFFYRTQGGAESDLVITEKFAPIACVEVKFTSAPRVTKGLTVAIEDLQTLHNYIIIPKADSPYPVHKNIWVYGLASFLDKMYTNGLNKLERAEQ